MEGPWRKRTSTCVLWFVHAQVSFVMLELPRPAARSPPDVLPVVSRVLQVLLGSREFCVVSVHPMAGLDPGSSGSVAWSDVWSALQHGLLSVAEQVTASGEAARKDEGGGKFCFLVKKPVEINQAAAEDQRDGLPSRLCMQQHC